MEKKNNLILKNFFNPLFRLRDEHGFYNARPHMRRCSDGIFRDSLLSQKFADNKINILNPKPFYFKKNSVLYVREEAFLEYLMKPFRKTRIESRGNYLQLSSKSRKENY